MEEYEYDAYVADEDDLYFTLDNFGVAIIPDVLSEEECTAMVSGMWDFLEHISSEWDAPLSRDDKTTWRGFYDLWPLHSMLIQHHTVGHAQVSWDLRQNPKIVTIFAKFWSERTGKVVKPEDLLVSFDGFSFAFPPEETNKGYYRGNTRYHADQSYNPGSDGRGSEFKCMQSWITGLDVNEGDATLGFLEGSHAYHEEFAKTFDVTDKTNWYKLSAEQQAWYLADDPATGKPRCIIQRIKCPKGSLVCWDSRTIHCGVESLKERPETNFRAVVYLCYAPRSQATEAALKKKRKAFEELRSTKHWPAKPELFAKEPWTRGKALPKMTPVLPPVVSKLGKRLAGY